MRLSRSTESENFWKTETGYELFKSSKETQVFSNLFMISSDTSITDLGIILLQDHDIVKHSVTHPSWKWLPKEINLFVFFKESKFDNYLSHNIIV